MACACVLAFAAAALPAQEPEVGDPAARCRALAAAQDAGALTVDAVVAAMADRDPEVARTAAAIVRHEWLELPPALFAALDRQPAAAAVFLRELAQAPRPAAAAWVQQRSAALPGRTPDERCLSLAARGGPWKAADVEVVVAALLAAADGDGVRRAVAVLPPDAAVLGLGRLVQALIAQQVEVEALLPWFERLPARAVSSLAAVAEQLPDEPAAVLLQALHERQPDAVRSEVALRLDDDRPLQPRWLGFVGPLLDRPARIAKVDAVLADARQPDRVRMQAALALLERRHVPAALLACADRGDALGRAVRARVLDRAIDEVPVERLDAWLADERGQAMTVAALRRRRALEPVLAQALLRRLHEAGTADGTFSASATAALLQLGSAAAVAEAWPLLRHSRDFDGFVDIVRRRPDPFVHDLLLAELAAADERVGAGQRRGQLLSVALALAARGDRRELQRLVDGAAGAEATFVGRCALVVRPLPVAAALGLLEALPMAAPDTAMAMIEWAATAADDERVQQRLWSLWRPAPGARIDEVWREAALRALAAGPHRRELVAELREALAGGPLPEALQPLPFALLDGMPKPPAGDDLRLCAELVLLPPRTDPEREAVLASRWPDGDRGYPLLAAVARAIGAADGDALERAFEPLLEAAGPMPRGRLLAFWRALQRHPKTQRRLGGLLAPLLLASPGEVGEGVAHWFLMHRLADGGDHAAAAAHAAASCALLRLPWHRHELRQFVGERDPGAGRDPWAALAAGRYVHAHRAALARGDAVAAAAAAAAAREFAGYDASVAATLTASATESDR